MTKRIDNPITYYKPHGPHQKISVLLEATVDCVPGGMDNIEEVIKHSFATNPYLISATVIPSISDDETAQKLVSLLDREHKLTEYGNNHRFWIDGMGTVSAEDLRVIADELDRRNATVPSSLD